MVWMFVATGVMLAGLSVVPMPWGAIFPVLFVGLTLFIVWDFTKQTLSGEMFKPEAIPNGVPAGARIVSVAQSGTSMTVSNIQFYELHIDVQVLGEDGSQWPARITQMVDLTNLAVLRPGEVIGVMYDPADPSHVVASTEASVDAAVPGLKADLKQRLRHTEATIAALRSTGIPATARIREYTLLQHDIIPGGDFINLAITVLPEQQPPFDASVDVAVASASTHKFQPGHTIYIKYDANQPQRLCMTGSDQPDTGRRVAYGHAV